MEKRRIILLGALIASLTVVGIGSVAAYSRIMNSSGTGCGSMNGSTGSGMMGSMGPNGMMGSGSMQGQCQNMMSQQNMAQCQAVIRQQNVTMSCC